MVANFHNFFGSEGEGKSKTGGAYDEGQVVRRRDPCRKRQESRNGENQGEEERGRMDEGVRVFASPFFGGYQIQKFFFRKGKIFENVNRKTGHHVNFRTVTYVSQPNPPELIQIWCVVKIYSHTMFPRHNGSISNLLFTIY